MIKLTVTEGPDKGKSIELEVGGTYTVGCDEEATLRLSDPMVLKGHCSIEVRGEFVIVRNHTASAGTYVGDKKIAQAKLRIPSRFRVGDSVLGITPAARRRQSAPRRDLSGKIIGGYKLIEPVGRGGMGTVYRATQLSLHRDVAVKVLSRELAKDKAFTDLFINEARAAAQLVHPNVVQVYDAGREGDISFFSMEFISQGSVEEILDRSEDRKLPWEEAILWVLEAAHGLAYAESKGIVHRDIKPDNLMINEAGQCKIADLGLAKRGEGGADEGIIGTPHFIPPEQALGKEVDGRADIYSLGATFFRMITGRTLFSGRTAREIVLKHINEPPPAASSIESSVPEDLDLVLARMLAKDASQRYEDTAALIAALEEVCANHGIKGSIIRRGVGKKVLIPMVLLLLVGAFVIWKLATKEPQKFTDPELVRQQKEAQERARRAALEQKRAQRDKRMADADRDLQALFSEFFKLRSENPIEAVYDDDTTKDALEKQWNKLRDSFVHYAALDVASEFEDELGLKSKAEEKAAFIHDRLEQAKASVTHRRKQIAAKVAEASKIDKENRDRLEDLLLRRHYNAAAALCNRITADTPGADDPFAPIATWVYRYGDMEQKATDIAEINRILTDARKYFRGEGAKILKRARKDWERIRDEKLAVLDEDASDDRIDAVLGELDEILQAFPEPATTPTLPPIKKILAEVRRARGRLAAEKQRRIEQRLRDDRQLVKALQRRLVSLVPTQTPNLVMHADFAAAKAEWNDLKRELKTPRYRAFAEERIRMLGWCEYLFTRFHADLKSSVAARDKSDRPMPELDLALPIPDSDRVLNTSFSRPPDDPYMFATRKRLSGKNEFHFSQFPMDWILNAVFFHEGNPRWRDPVPAVRFALGAFCFETMQYAAAKRQFDTLLDDQVHGPVARLLSARAEREEAARHEWVDVICKGVHDATSTAELDELSKRIASFPTRHEGTIFYLEVMSHKTVLSRDFHDETQLPISKWPAVPEE